MLSLLRVVGLGLLAFACTAAGASAAEGVLKLEKGDKIVLVGNTLAERMQYYGNWETQLHARFPQLNLVVRNLGWSGDELTIQQRSKDFQDHGHNLADHKPNVILAFYGFNESFGGKAGLAKFTADLEKYISETKAAKYNGKSAPRLVVFSPIAHENVERAGMPDGKANNANLQLYAAAMAEVCKKLEVPFVDLCGPSLKLMDGASKKLTINGIHLNERGDAAIAEVMNEALFGATPDAAKTRDLTALKAEVNAKNLEHFYDYRAVNGFYIYGGRKKPFGVVNFPPEIEKLRKMVSVRDGRVWSLARGEKVPAEADYSQTGDFVKIETNYKSPIKITSPEEAEKRFTLAPGYEVNLFASEVEFPELQKPVQFAFDAKGRLWICTMNSYPHYLPGVLPNDKILILEDTNADGKADKQTIFADKLYLPTGIEFGEGGIYVGCQPNLMFLKDTNGDDKADEREVILMGFDSADSHHAIHAFTWDQGGALYFGEGIFHRTAVETPYGPVRCSDAGVFRFDPRTYKFSVWASYPFSNPWGHVVDGWGQNFVADASPGFNYFGTAFSGDVDWPTKHKGNMKQFLTKQWRPSCGCELITSRHFPDDAQGNYLLNNCIGFQGTLQYKVREDGSGFAAEPVEPLIKSSDPNYRPVDIELGPDGALYLCDWFNPLVGHMQHSIRDPNRDHTHGRIWRVTAKGRPLSSPAKIAGEPTSNVLELLKEKQEERTRYRARTELRSRPTAEVMAALEAWVSKLDPQDKNFEHHRLEALWLKQAHDVVDAELLKKVLRSPEPKARAAATRVLCYWTDRVGEPLKLLEEQVNDEHPRVRLEAIRALSFFKGDDAAKALEIAVLSLAAPQDDYLKYTLEETMSTLDKRSKK